jgi:predicted ATPase/DNA-binding winged helix-turn-helix (wHTH) protein
VLYRFGDCELHEELFELRRAGARVPIQPKVLSLLLFLVRERARAVDRRELFRAIWSDVKVSDDSIARAILEARRAIGDDKHEMITTVRGRGFRFAAEVTEALRAPVPPVASHGFVGRDACLATLRACLEQALAGRAGSAAIVGDAGLGKTRLAEELATVARARGAHVLFARIHRAPPSPPFWPWTQLVGALASGFGEVAADLVRKALALLATARGGDFPTFEAVTLAFRAAAAQSPLVIVADDVHWADEGSLLLLGYFAREVRDARVLLVWTYRDTAVGDDARGRALAAALRESGSVPVPLGGLTREESARLVSELKGHEPSPQFAAALHERTGGSPLFIRQVLETEWAARALEDSARSFASSIDLQNGVRASIDRHLDGVSPECREVLVCAALLGKDLEFAALAAVTGLESKTLLDRLDEAARGRLVTKRKDGHYRFVLPLVADVLYQQLPASERAARHRAAAEALRLLYDSALDAHASRIAYHFFRAAPSGTAREAYAYSVRAARHEEVRGDARAAVKQWEQAAWSLDLVPVSDPARLDVQLALARARTLSADYDGARESFLDAAMLARALGKPEALAEAALEFSRLADASDARRSALLVEARGALETASGPRAPHLLQLLLHADDP